MTDPADRPDPPPARPPRLRVDPAAMRETLDVARRRLGQTGPADEEPHSAEQLRALLREAADQAVPQDRRLPPTPDPSPRTGTRPEPLD